MNVTGRAERGVSTTYTMTVGSEAASASAMTAPDADHVKISIWPGVSMRTCAGGVSEATRFSTSASTWSNLVAKRLRAVRMPPFGPSWYCFMTPL